MTKQIPIEVLDVLKQAKCDGHKLTLQGQLDRKLYEATNKFLDLLGGKWTKGVKAHVFDGDCAERVDEAIMTGEVVDSKKLYQFFETPPDLAARMVEKLAMTRDHSVLEPSAGHGSLIRAVLNEFPGKTVHYCELDSAKHEKLPKGAVPAWCEDDFLKTDPQKSVMRFDRIIANPPFRNGQDIAHVQHMYRWLNDGGRIVTVTSPSWQYRANGKYAQFRDWLADVRHHEVEELPAGTFNSSGTNISTLLLTIDK